MGNSYSWRSGYHRLFLSALLLGGVAPQPTQAQTPATFQNPATYSVNGSNPWGVAVADVNGDGKPDVFTANVNSSSVSVLLGNGNGSFQSPMPSPVNGSNPYGMAVVDVNGDGKPDVLTANYNSNTVSVLLGNGNGTFQNPASYPVNGSTPYSLAVADVNGDGRPDVLTANTSSSTVSVLLGNGNGSFQNPATYPVNGSSPWGVAVADVNGDGRPDVLTANAGSSSVSVLLGNGNGSFQSPATYTVNGGAPRSVAVADVNGDGRPDVLTANSSSNTVSVLLGNGNGTFQNPATYPVNGGTPWGVAVADVNGDDKPDVLTANAGTSTVSVLLGNGNGSFQSPATYTVNGGAPRIVAVADVNGDGRPDVLTANTSTNSVSVLLNTTTRPAPTVSLSSQTNVACNGESSGAATASASGGTAPYTYSWRNTTTSTTLAATGSSVSGLAAGSYTVTVTDNNSQTGTANFTITEPTALATTGSQTNVTTSGGSDGTATVSVSGGTAPYTILWSNGQTGATATNLSAGTYVAHVYSANGTPGDFSPSGCYKPTSFTITQPAPSLVINTLQQVPAGTYTNITVQNGGQAELQGGGNITVQGTLRIEAGGVLDTRNAASFVINGPGNFVLAAGGAFYICSPQGISTSGATGTVQVAGTRSFSSDAIYLYGASTAQVTGMGLPSQVKRLHMFDGIATLTLSQPLAVKEVLSVFNRDFDLNGQPLTLLSSDAGTALVENLGSGRVIGNTATVQRYVGPGANPGPGYRHYASPVSGNTLADLTTAGFTPTFNPDYNAASNPGAVKPFPTVFGYDQSRLASATNTLAPFDKGWFSPTATTPFTPGTGYAVNLPASELVDFTGTLNSGDYILNLERNSGATAADAGWALVGNPYPSPLDLTRFARFYRPNLDAAVYVYESTGSYAGGYRAFVNGQGNPFVATAQAFFMRVSEGQTSGQLKLYSELHRVTNPDTQVPMYRSTTTDTRPQLQLVLAGQSLSDALTVYAQAGATDAADAEFDAVKLPNPHGLNLSSLAGSGQALAIDGRPAFTAATSLPLNVSVPVAGSYSFTAATLANLAGTRAELVDNLLGTRTLLVAGTAYSFTATSTNQAGRFWLNLAPATVLATASATLAAQVLVYPNPAHGSITVRRPATSQSASATLLNSLGQTVRTLVLPTAETTLDLSGLAPGVYSLRLGLNGQSVVKRVVVN